MLFRIGAYAHAKAGLFPDGAHEFAGVCVTVRFRSKALLACEGIAPQRHHIVDSHEVEILQLPFNLPGGVSRADDMGYYFYREMGLDAGANGHGGHAVADYLAFVAAVRKRGILEFIPMGGHIDIPGLEIHQGANAVQQFTLGDSAQGRNDFQRGKGVSGREKIGDSHNRWDKKVRASFGEKPRAFAYCSNWVGEIWWISG